MNDDNRRLRLIKEARESDKSNFWKCCPLAKDYLPESACPAGEPTVNEKNGKIQDEPSCVWWINSKDHNYCFWRYIKDKSDENGMMKELVQSELADLFGWSNTKTHFMLKQAVEELTQALNDHGAAELLAAVGVDDGEQFLSSSASHRTSNDEPLE